MAKENLPTLSVNHLIGNSNVQGSSTATHPLSAAHDNPAAGATPRAKDRFRVVSCANKVGCTWPDAQERCSLFAMRVCSRNDIQNMWPHGLDMHVNGDVALAWTADETKSDAFEGVGKKQLLGSRARFNSTVSHGSACAMGVTWCLAVWVVWVKYLYN